MTHTETTPLIPGSPIDWLLPNTPFHFPGSDLIHTNLGHGYYRDPDGRKWRTGTRTHVLKIEEPA